MKDYFLWAAISIFMAVLLMSCLCGCSEENIKPDSISVGFVHERVRSTGDDWKGYTVGATWELK